MTHPQVWQCDWKSLEDQWPPDPKEQVFFYNSNLNIYTVDSMDGIEDRFKKHQAYLSEFLNMADDDLEAQFWVSHRYRFTHWDYLPLPPT